MLSPANIQNFEIVRLETEGQALESLLEKEWLLTNNRGGYSSSSVAGCNSRRYHSLLTGALNPPANRIMALSNCLEMITAKNVQYLSTFEFPDKIFGEGYKSLKRFRQDIGVHFDYELDAVELTRSIYMHPEQDIIAIEYDITKVDEPFELIVRPFAGLRDFHSLQKSYALVESSFAKGAVTIKHKGSDDFRLVLKGEELGFNSDQQWWFNFKLRKEEQRGQDFTEDLWSPGFYKADVNGNCRLVLWVCLAAGKRGEVLQNCDIESLKAAISGHQNDLINAAKPEDENVMRLVLAADQFVTYRQNERQAEAGEKLSPRATILAGYPWFADWGRDAFISFEGLLLDCGRFDEARSVLTTFADAVDDGMIPNRFDDYSNTACFNSIDASLWFIKAAFRYLEVTGDSDTFENQLIGTICTVVRTYHVGTRFNIHADSDGLITAGDKDTQLTWMDAKCDGVCFTPRYGKAVEINALWYNSLCLLGNYYKGRDDAASGSYHEMADKVEDSFRKTFWNRSAGYLNDCVLPDGTVDASLRPNQIIAVSLEYSPLTRKQQMSVVEAVFGHLLTPYGLRSLNRHDYKYKGIYKGNRFARDEAYHQGTVWAWLIGPFIEAYLKINNFSSDSRKQAYEMLVPLLLHMRQSGCMGQISEIFDGDAPHDPRGCFAQAWSVAEVLRAYKLIRG